MEQPEYNDVNGRRRNRPGFRPYPPNLRPLHPTTATTSSSTTTISRPHWFQPSSSPSSNRSCQRFLSRASAFQPTPNPNPNPHAIPLAVRSTRLLKRVCCFLPPASSPATLPRPPTRRRRGERRLRRVPRCPEERGRFDSPPRGLRVENWPQPRRPDLFLFRRGRVREPALPPR